MTTLVTCATSTETFDTVYRALLGTDVHAGMAHLRHALNDLRDRLTPVEWRAVGEAIRSHPLHALLRQSPFTHRAYAKPRGYAGDAVLMDLIYGACPDFDLMSPLGGMLYAFEFDSPCFQSVRTRRAILAREIDDVAATRPDARVLSVACGHLREVEWSRAARDRRASIIAVDQDPDSTAVVDAQYGRYNVGARCASVGDLLRRSLRVDDLDLAYAAGLYDYLADDVARALTLALWRMLRPGGRLLIANFTPATGDAAFMEAAMDWHLVYRTPAELRSLAASIADDRVAAVEQFTDANRHVAYLRVTKR